MTSMLSNIIALLVTVISASFIGINFALRRQDFPFNTVARETEAASFESNSWTTRGENQRQDESKFNPYADNGGTVIGISGRNYCIIAADTRLSDNYMIRSRSVTRIFEIGSNLLLSGSGCLSDTIALAKVLEIQSRNYLWENKRHMNIRAASHLLSNILYSRRHLPYYSFSIIGGFDEKGIPRLFRYDALGSCEQVKYASAGKGEQMIQPLLDEISGMDRDDSLWSFDCVRSEFDSSNERCCVSIDESSAIDLVIKCFRAAAEREITVGDGIEIVILRRNESGDVRKETCWHRLPQH